MMLATHACCGGKVETIGEILRPTKGTRSYPQIAILANEWIRQQVDAGHYPVQSRLSSEHVRRIFEDQTARPNALYLRALAAVQNVDPVELLQIAGYPTPRSNNAVDAVRDALRANTQLSDTEKAEVLEYVRQKLGENRERSAA